MRVPSLATRLGFMASLVRSCSHRVFPSSRVANALGASVVSAIGDPVGQARLADAPGARRLLACKARSGRIVTMRSGDRRRSRPLWSCPWLSARDCS